MDHTKYGNLVKAALHLYNNFNIMNCFNSDNYLYCPILKQMINLCVFRDEYETGVEVSYDGDDDEKHYIVKIKIVDYCKTFDISKNKAHEKESFCNIVKSDIQRLFSMNYVELDSDKVMLSVGTKNNATNINTIEEEHFQLSTINEIEPIERYYYTRDVYQYYNEFIPRGVGLVVKAGEPDTEDMIDFITKKVWGIIALQ